MRKITLNKLNQTFSLEKFEAKALNILALCCQEVEKFNLVLECLLPYTHSTIHPKFIGGGIENIGKPKKLLSVMTVQTWLQ